MQVNVEVKTPETNDVAKAKYRPVMTRLLAQLKASLIDKPRNAIVSSFNHEVLSQFSDQPIRLLYLYTAENALPGVDVTNQWDLGANLEPDSIDSKVVERFHTNGQLVGIWYSKRKTDEGPILWQKMLDLGVDLFCSDMPLEA